MPTLVPTAASTPLPFVNELFVLPIVIVLLLLGQPYCLASDWGYENLERAPGQQTGRQAAPATSRQQAVQAMSRQQAVEEFNRREAAPESQKRRAVEDWLQLYTFIAGEQLSAEQKFKFRKQVEQPASSHQEDQLLSVLRFWPKIRQVTNRNLDQVESYRSLLKALLRAQLHYKPESIVGGREFALELLGPSRIAVPGDPPLTEAAINSYCDMACFLFEQKNPGRSMDVTENRAFFAKVIEDKFKNAPDAAAKEAMSSFDLNWAQFKIVWTDATPVQRKELLKQWTEPSSAGSNTLSGANNAASNPVLNQVLKEGPWNLLSGKVAGL